MNQARQKLKSWMKRGGFWPVFLITLLASHASLMIWAATKAIGDPSFAVVDDYYQKAVHFDQRKQELAASEALGWQFKLGVNNADAQRKLVVATLHDRWGVPLRGAEVRMRCTRLADGSVHELALVDEGEGVYRASEALAAGGVYDVETRVVFAEQVFVQQREAWLPGPSASGVGGVR